MWPFKKPNPVIIHRGEIQQVVELLFPNFTTEEMPDGTIFQIDRSIDSNLDAALTDLQDGKNDFAVQKTISGVLNRLITARKILQAYPMLDTRAKYIIVDNLEHTEVEAGE